MKKKISLQLFLMLIILVMAITGVLLLMYTSSKYKQLIYENKVESTTNLIKTNSRHNLKLYRKKILNFGMRLQGKQGLRTLIQRKDSIALRALLDDQFDQFLFSSGELALQRLYIFDKNINLISKSKRGFIPQDDSIPMCNGLVKQARNRSGSAKMQSLHAQCVKDGKSFFAMMIPIGTFNPVGYLLLAIDLASIQIHLVGILGDQIDMQFLYPDGSIAYSTQQWKKDISDGSERIIETFESINQNGETILYFNFIEPLDEFKGKLDATTRSATFTALIIYGFAFIIVFVLLRQIVKALHTLKEGAKQLSHGKSSHLPETDISEFNDVISSFNKMSQRIVVLIDELNDAKTKSDQANKSKSTFLANMSHEIRTPMNAVLGYTQILLRDTAFPENYRKQVGTIEKAGSHLLDLINDILDLSKIEAGSMEVHTQDFDLNELVNGMGDLFEMRCQKRDLLWTLENRIQGPGLVRSDQGKLRQILINFLGNAVKFTDEGEVKFTVSNSANQYYFEVADTGMGIAPSELVNIHEPFHQAAEGIKKGGTGLGLAISQRQLELLGSEMQVDSELGKGSRFYFDLTLPDAESAVPARTSRDNQSVYLAPGYAVNALVVDDVEENRDILQHMLLTAGITVRTAINGEDCLAKMNEHIPDIVFMDIRMPEMNGSEALKRIKADYGDHPIVCIAVTSSALLHEMKGYLDEGFDDIIGKPFRFGEIYHRIEKFLSVKLIENQQQLESQPDTAEEIKHRRVELIRGICIPETLYSRLKNAAELNALTDIEEIIDVLDKLGGESQSLSMLLQDYISDYDTESILKVLEEISYA